MSIPRIPTRVVNLSDIVHYLRPDLKATACGVWMHPTYEPQPFSAARTACPTCEDAFQDDRSAGTVES